MEQPVQNRSAGALMPLPPEDVSLIQIKGYRDRSSSGYPSKLPK